MATHQNTAVRLLVIDDDEAIQLLMAAIFRRHGIRVDAVADGAAALELLRAHTYDAVVLDLMMAGCNGFDVVAELKQSAPELLGRVIVLTAASDLILRTFNDADAVRRVMRKPFDLDEFVDEVVACSPESFQAAAHSLQ